LISSNPVKNACGIVNSGGVGNTLGYLVTTPDGSKVASVIFGMDMIQLFSFNNATGLISYDMTIKPDPNNSPYGVSFSPKSSKLYAGIFSGPSKGIVQYDLSLGDTNKIQNSGFTFLTKYSPGAIQIGPDQKIYCAFAESKYLGQINDPDNRGVHCNFIENGVFLNNKKCALGLPDLVQSYLLVHSFTYINMKTCLGWETKFAISLKDSVDSVTWNFGDLFSKDNMSKEVSPAHIYARSGAYDVILKSFYQGNEFNYQQTVTIPDLLYRQATDTINVGYQDCPFYLNIPNAFTPDNDFLNDSFRPVMNYPPVTYNFTIYNRWGEKVFFTTDYKSGWDGTFQNVKAIEGAYIYTVNAFSYIDAKNIYRSGIFYLVRH
jgi:gliding motility-associated-like protein